MSIAVLINLQLIIGKYDQFIPVGKRMQVRFEIRRLPLHLHKAIGIIDRNDLIIGADHVMIVNSDTLPAFHWDRFLVRSVIIKYKYPIGRVCQVHQPIFVNDLLRCCTLIKNGPEVRGFQQLMPIFIDLFQFIIILIKHQYIIIIREPNGGWLKNGIFAQIKSS